MLALENVELGSVTLTTPLLTSLSITRCTCKSGFDVSAPKLASLILYENESLNLKTFFTCTDIESVDVRSFESSIEPIYADGKHLLKLLDFWPKIPRLMLDGVNFKNLATGSIPADNDDTLPLNLESFTLWNVDLDSEQLPWILYLLKKSPLLGFFSIWFGEDVMEDIDEPMDFKLDRLGCVMVYNFTASRNQIMFVKILLKHAPLLEEVDVLEDEELDPEKGMDILKELLVLQRINPKAEILFYKDY